MAVSVKTPRLKIFCSGKA